MCNKSCSNYLHYTFKGHCADDFDIYGQDHKIMSDLQQVLGGCRCSLKSYLQKSLKNGVFSIKFCFKIYFTTFFAKLLSSHLPPHLKDARLPREATFTHLFPVSETHDFPFETFLRC